MADISRWAGKPRRVVTERAAEWASGYPVPSQRRASTSCSSHGASTGWQRLCNGSMRRGLRSKAAPSTLRDFPEAIAEAYAWASDANGEISLAVHAAGTVYPGSIAEGNVSDWQDTIGTNLLGVMYGSQQALKRMLSPAVLLLMSPAHRATSPQRLQPIVLASLQSRASPSAFVGKPLPSGST